MRDAVAFPPAALRPRPAQRPPKQKGLCKAEEALSPPSPHVRPSSTTATTAPATRTRTKAVAVATAGATHTQSSASPLSDRPRRSRTNAYSDSLAGEDASARKAVVGGGGDETSVIQLSPSPSAVRRSCGHRFHPQRRETEANSSLLSYDQRETTARRRGGESDLFAGQRLSWGATPPRPNTSHVASASSSVTTSFSSSSRASSPLPASPPTPSAAPRLAAAVTPRAAWPHAETSQLLLSVPPPRHRETDEDAPYVNSGARQPVREGPPLPPRPAKTPAALVREHEQRRRRKELKKEEEEVAETKAAALEAVLTQLDGMIGAQERRAAWQLESYLQSATEAQRGWTAVRTALAELTEASETDETACLPSRIADFLVRKREQREPYFPHTADVSTTATAAAVAATTTMEREVSLASELQATSAELHALRAWLRRVNRNGEGAQEASFAVQERAQEQLHALLVESYEQSLRLQRTLEEERAAHAQTRLALLQQREQQPRRQQQQQPRRTTPHPTVAGDDSGEADTLSTARRALASTRPVPASLGGYKKSGRGWHDPQRRAGFGTPRGTPRPTEASSMTTATVRPTTAASSPSPTTTSYLSVSEEDVWNITREVLAKYAGRDLADEEQLNSLY